MINAKYINYLNKTIDNLKSFDDFENRELQDELKAAYLKGESARIFSILDQVALNLASEGSQEIVQKIAELASLALPAQAPLPLDPYEEKVEKSLQEDPFKITQAKDLDGIPYILAAKVQEMSSLLRETRLFPKTIEEVTQLIALRKRLLDARAQFATSYRAEEAKTKKAIREAGPIHSRKPEVQPQTPLYLRTAEWIGQHPHLTAASALLIASPFLPPLQTIIILSGTLAYYSQKSQLVP